MFGWRYNLWRVLVWAMIPLTLSTSLPRMHCRCAEAQGTAYSECCFQMLGLLGNSSKQEGSQRRCCQRKRQAQQKVASAASSAPNSERSKSAERPQLGTPQSAGCSCCYLTPAQPLPVSQVVHIDVDSQAIHWDVAVSDELPSLLINSTRHDYHKVLLQELDPISLAQRLVV